MAEEKKKIDTPVTSGTSINFESKLKGLVLLSKVWGSANVGIFVDVPVSGTPLQRMLIARYGLYAFEKASGKMFNTQSLGIFNYRMRKEGINDISAMHSISSDGAPTSIRVVMTAKPHRAGVMLGNLMTKVFFSPAVGDLTTPLLAGFPRDKPILLWAAQKFLEALPSAQICIIGSKGASVKESFKAKFDKAYAKKKDPDLSGGKAPSITGEDAEKVLMKDSCAVEYATKGAPVSLAIMAQAMSGYGIVGMHGDTITLSADPDYGKYAVRMSKATLTNANKVSAVVRMYERLAEKDKVSGASFPTIMAIAGISSGLPIAVGKKILASGPVKAAAIATEISKIIS
jgi:hypothetical protein